MQKAEHIVSAHAAQRAAKSKFHAHRHGLPIFPAREPILKEISESRCTIIVGETGSGKTTQIPQYIFESGLVYKGAKIHQEGKIAVTQPRRVAATSVARRVAEEMGVPLGDKVGYSVRFDEKSSHRTRIKFLTDGMLLREAILDPMLKQYSVIILDEAHERTLQTDMLFGIVKDILVKRHDLRVVVMSATLEAEQFASFFHVNTVLLVQGRQHPVQIYHTPTPEEDYLDATLTAILQIHLHEARGDVLVFVTGQEDIETLEELLRDRKPLLPKAGLDMIVCPLFASLPAEKQMEAFQPTPPHARKVILATNIAESSVTISGVRYVVDCGLVKTRVYNGKYSMESLQVVPISQASARQRSGRAGREAPGKTFRLYPEEQYDQLDAFMLPEIKRVNLAGMVLQLKVLGFDDVIRFSYVDPPPLAELTRALALLHSLGALDRQGKLTDPVGRRMAQLPLDPRHARALVEAEACGCKEDMLSLVAMLNVENVIHIPRQKRDEAKAVLQGFFAPAGDQQMLLNIYNAFISEGKKHENAWCRSHFVNFRSLRKARDIRKQLSGYCSTHTSVSGNASAAQRSELSAPSIAFPRDAQNSDMGPLTRALLAGFHQQLAQRLPDGSYQTIAGRQKVRIHPSSVLAEVKRPPVFVLFNEVVFTTHQYMRGVLAVDLNEMRPYISGSMHSDGSRPSTTVPRPSPSPATAAQPSGAPSRAGQGSSALSRQFKRQAADAPATTVARTQSYSSQSADAVRATRSEQGGPFAATPAVRSSGTAGLSLTQALADHASHFAGPPVISQLQAVSTSKQSEVQGPGSVPASWRGLSSSSRGTHQETSSSKQVATEVDSARPMATPSSGKKKHQHQHQHHHKHKHTHTHAAAADWTAPPLSKRMKKSKHASMEAAVGHV